MRLAALALIFSFCTQLFAIDTQPDSLLLLLRNDLNVALALKDASNDRTWDISNNSNRLINLLAAQTHVEGEEPSNITFPISLSIYYTKGKSMVAIPGCLPSDIKNNSIVQVFNGNNGIECFFSEYHINQD